MPRCPKNEGTQELSSAQLTGRGVAENCAASSAASQRHVEAQLRNECRDWTRNVGGALRQSQIGFMHEIDREQTPIGKALRTANSRSGGAIYLPL